MTDNELKAYRKMYRTLAAALDEIKTPGISRTFGIDIVDKIERARNLAWSMASDEF